MTRILLLAALLFVFSFSSSTSAFYHTRGTDVRSNIATKVAQKAAIEEKLEELRNRSKLLRQERRRETAERQATKRAEIATKVAELRAKVIERIKEVFSTILDRMTAALVRLDKIVNRINSRIAKLKERGIDTQKSSLALATCSNVQAQAANAIKDAKTKVVAISPGSTTVVVAVQQAGSAIRGSKRALQDYHKCLVNVVATLKAGIPKEATVSAQ